MHVCETCNAVIVDPASHEHAVTPLAVTRSIDPVEQPTLEELDGGEEIPRQRGAGVDVDD